MDIDKQFYIDWSIEASFASWPWSAVLGEWAGLSPIVAPSEPGVTSKVNMFGSLNGICEARDIDLYRDSCYGNVDSFLGGRNHAMDWYCNSSD